MRSEWVMELKRVAVIGSSGAGKSTFAKKLSEISGLPLHHLDRLYWKPHWVETPREEFRMLQRNIVQEIEWIIDGNYSFSFDERLPFTDTIVFLDYSRPLCLFRVLKRQILYRKKQRSDITENCEERLSKEFLLWVWDFPNRGRPKIFTALKNLSHKPEVIILKTSKQTANWLLDLKNQEKIIKN